MNFPGFYLKLTASCQTKVKREKEEKKMSNVIGSHLLLIHGIHMAGNYLIY